MVEFTSGLLPLVVRDLVQPLAKRLGEKFTEILINKRVTALDAENGNVAVTFSDKSDERLVTSFEKVLGATGRRPVSWLGA